MAATRWVAERVAIADCPRFSDYSAYAAMDFLVKALGEIAASIFDSVGHLLNLDVDIVFIDTTFYLSGGRQRRRAGRPAARAGGCDPTPSPCADTFTPQTAALLVT
jgi:hypothetical protein